MNRPKALNEQCSTCIFHPGNLMDLRPGRVSQMVRDCVTDGGYITCHQTLDEPGVDRAACRGFLDTAGPRSNGVRIIERLGGFELVDPPVKEKSRG